MSYFTEFDIPSKPIFKNNVVSVKSCGAACDGVTIDTECINKAIGKCFNLGGGTVFFEKGTYLTGPIHLKSNIELHFEDGCKVIFSTDKNDYLPVVYTNFEGVRCYNYSPLIYGNNLKNVAITGSVLLNGGGDTWWDLKSVDKGVNELYKAGFEETPVEQRVYGTVEYGLRPCFIQILNSENVYLDGLHLENSPFWNIHIVWCINVNVKNIFISNPFESPNTDGINIDASMNVVVDHCRVDSGGDDVYCIKSGRGKDGRNVNIPCKNVIISNCSAGKVNGGGLAIGSEMSGGVDNIHLYNCSFENTCNGVRIKTKRGRGGYVKNIYCHDVKLGSVERVINVCLRYAYDNQFIESGADLLPDIGNMHFENFECDKAEYGLILEGLDDDFIKNIYVKNLRVEKTENGVLCQYVSGLVCSDIYA